LQASRSARIRSSRRGPWGHPRTRS
jgi:hypothetical protein